MPPPLRFLALIVGGWTTLRIVALAPGWAGKAPEVAVLEPPVPIAAEGPPVRDPELVTFQPPLGAGRDPFFARSSGVWRRLPSKPARTSWAILVPVSAPQSSPIRSEQPVAAFLPPPPRNLAQLFPPASPQPRERRWAGSAWVFFRDGDTGSALVPAGELGGSQAGLRLTYRLAGRRAPLALSGRLYLPLERPEGAEAALGLDWRPLPGVPIHLLAERREAVGRDGRSDFALTLYGGGERRLGPVRLEAWGQAGAVGIEDPDLFADGLARATTRVGPLDIGAGLWGGAQSGAARLDAGPHVSARLPVEGVNLRVMAEWRLRVAGDAAPGSGPALILVSDF